MWPDNEPTNKFTGIRGSNYVHYSNVEHIVKIVDIIDTKVYFRVDGVEIPRIVTLVLYKHDDMLYVDEVTTFSDEYTLIEPVYEYQYAFEMECGKWTTTDFFTDFEAHRRTNCAFHKLEFTKRERKCI